MQATALCIVRTTGKNLTRRDLQAESSIELMSIGSVYRDVLGSWYMYLRAG